MSKLTKGQLKKIASMHSAGVLLATEALQAFQDTDLSHEELEYIDETIEKIAVQLLKGLRPLYDANEIVEFVKLNP